MTEKDILDLFKSSKALLEGHFLLSSGLHSAKYMQCALLLQDPAVSGRICGSLAEKLKGFNPTLIVGPALGGVIVAHEVARALGIKGIFTERVDGKMCLRRGFTITPQDKIVVVEDVITTGLSTKEVIEVIRTYGAEVVGAGCLADRSAGKADLGVPYTSLLKLDIPVYKAEECPMCSKKTPLVKPGSRTAK